MSKRTDKSPEENANLEIWTGWPDVTPYAKKVAGQFYSAIDATWQCQECTRKWGPYGHKWGLRDVTYTPIMDAGNVTSIVASGQFFYPVDDAAQASFLVAADMDYRWGEGTKRAGQIIDDIWKKLLTELRSKALLMLGFGTELALEQGKYRTEEEASADTSVRDPGYDKGTDPRVITEAQQKRLFAIAHKHEPPVPDDELKRIVKDVAGVEHSKEITRAAYDTVVAAVEAWKPPTGGPTTQTCPECKKPYPIDDKKCPHCGSELPF